ncbi:MAG: OmpA family protein [Bacteroidota bacterium]
MRYINYLFKILLLLVITSNIAFSQSNATKSADKLFESFDFTNAAKAYEKLIKKNPNDLYTKQKIADSYRLLNNSQLAEFWYGQLITIEGADPINKFYYAQALRNNAKYDEAKAFYQEYAIFAPKDKRSTEILKGIELITVLGRDNPMYDVTICPFNTKYSDYSPYIYKNEVLFVSNGISTGNIDPWTQRPFTQVYTVNKDSINTSNFSKPELFLGNTINGKYHEGPLTIDRELNDLYLTRSNYTNKFVRATDKSVKLKIFRLSYVSAENKFGDKLIQDFPYNNDQYSCAHPAISRDGQEMYFTSDMPGGLGGSDIYVSKKEGYTWGTPQNLKEINTAGNESFPFFAADNTLYFASDGHFGLGGLDVYYIRKDSDNKWSKIVNLGAPVNSSADDFGYVQNESGSEGYFTSNRAGGIGDDDIYSFTKAGLTICGDVIDAETSAKLPGSNVKLYDGTRMVKELTADEKGSFCFEVEPYKKYRILASNIDYVSKDMILDMKNESQNIQIPLKKKAGILLDVYVIDSKLKTPISAADVKLISLKTNQEAPKVTNANGHVFYDLETETEYKVVAEKTINESEKYLANSTTFNTKGVKAPADLNITIELRREMINTSIELKDILYDLDKFYIRPDAALILDKLVKLLKDNPTMEIELGSHTDCRSSKTYNMWLSAKRAEAAVNYLIKNGINPFRLIAAGYGESRIKNGCNCEPGNNSPCTEEQHQENRRTEFKIYKF